MKSPVSTDLIAAHNDAQRPALEAEYAALGDKLARNGVSIDRIKAAVSAFEVAVPTWGVGTGGTRFARFPGPGEPRSIWEKLDDCGVIRQLSVFTPRVSPHFPWDCVDDYAALRDYAGAYRLGFDAVNSNTFQDRPGQPHSYKYGSLTHTDADVRAQAVAHNLECIDIGARLGARAITVWIGDGANFPGQQDFTGALERYLESGRQIYAALPDDWSMFIEHKLFEPSFYATVIQDWGTSVLCAKELGEKALCLVDLGHHAPNVNIEMIVARLNQFGKLGGFHFNDSKYGDDDLDSGSINPFQLFLAFNELVAAGMREGDGFAPAYMIDQSHNVTDPLESLMNSVDALAQSFAKALIVDRAALAGYQDENDAIMAHRTLKAAYETDTRPIAAMARIEANGAADPIGAYRAAEYRRQKAEERPQTAHGGGGGIV